MKKVCVIEIEWNIKGDNGHEILCVTDVECAQTYFKTFLKEEKLMSWLKDYFNKDGSFNEEYRKDVTEYIDDDRYFEFSTNNYECYTIMTINEFDVFSKL